MLSTRVKELKRKYQRAKIEFSIKLNFFGGRQFDVTTEEISYMGFHFFCDHAMASDILPEGIYSLSKANPKDCDVEIDDDNETIRLAAQIESMSRLSQDSYKIAITFDDQTTNLDNYQKYKHIIDGYFH